MEERRNLRFSVASVVLRLLHRRERCNSRFMPHLVKQFGRVKERCTVLKGDNHLIVDSIHVEHSHRNERE